MQFDRVAPLLLLYDRIRLVHILSSQVRQESVSWEQRDGSLVSVRLPSAIATYTQYMRDIDSGHQLRK